jgi:hypothetical protein
VGGVGCGLNLGQDFGLDVRLNVELDFGHGIWFGFF